MDGPISILSGTCVHRRERAMTNSRHLGQTDRGEKNGKDMTTAQIKNRMHRPKREGRTKTNTYMDNHEGKGRFVRIV